MEASEVSKAGGNGQSPYLPYRLRKTVEKLFKKVVNRNGITHKWKRIPLSIWGELPLHRPSSKKEQRVEI